MMRVIFLLLVSSIALQSKSQTWNNYLQKRFKSYGIWADSVLLLPSDTTINKAAKSLAVKNGNLYIANGTYWTEISGGSSVVDSLLNIINGRATFGDVRDIVHDTANVLVRIADSAAMLNPYLRKVDTAEFVKKTRTLTIGKNGSATDLSDDRVFLDSVPNINTTNATNITSGTLDDARLSNNVALKNIDNLFSSNQTISKTTPEFRLTDANNRNIIQTRNETDNLYTLTNVVSEVGGSLSNCISFNNGNQYITSTPSGITGVTTWSVSFWINRTSQSGINIVYFGDGTNNYQITICCGGTGHLGVYYNASINNWFSSTTVATSGWQHFVVTKDAGGTLRVYINGALNNTPVATISNIGTISSFRIGNVSGLPNVSSVVNAPTSQRIDQVLLYTTALSLANVQTIYNSGTGTPTIPTSNLVLRYELNEGTGTTTADVTATNATGTLVNGVVWNIANGRIPTELAFENAFLIRSRDGIYTGNRGENRFGDPLGGTWISGRSVKFTRTDESFASFIHGESGNTLISPNNTTLNATSNNALSVVGSASIGENVAAPTNGLRVLGQSLFQANTFFGGTTTPTALLHLDKNRSTAGNAPIKFTLGGAALLTTPERGALEAMPYRLHFTDSSNQRNTLAYLSDVYKTPMNVADSNYTVAGDEIIIGYTGLTADRACTLPNPASHAGKSLTLFAKGMNDYDLNFSSSYKPKNLNDSTITSVKGDLPKHGVDTGSAIEGFSMKLVSFNNEWVILNYFTHYK